MKYKLLVKELQLKVRSDGPPNSNPRLIIFAHARSGSTTLQRCFSAHPRLRVLNEPFNHSRGKDGWEPRYLDDLAIDNCLPRVLDGIDQQHHGIKHVIGALSPEQEGELLGRYRRRIFMTRRNQLQAIVSMMIALQTRRWHRRGRPRICEQTLAPIPLEKVAEYLASQRQEIQRFETMLRDRQWSHVRVDYEDLFAPSVSLDQRVDVVLRLIAPMVNRRFPADFRQRMRTLLGHDANKVNSVETYRMVPNIDEIQRQFAGEPHGSLWES